MMKKELSNYDLFPKVVTAGATVEITIQPLGRHAMFKAGQSFNIKVHPLSEGSPRTYSTRPNIFTYDLVPNVNGGFTFTHTFQGEQEHFIRVCDGDKVMLQLSAYSVAADLAGRYPYMGDLHMHSFHSDGMEAPEIVAANYRKYGYDFLAITDHHKYYPSLEAMHAFKDLPIDFTLVPGEEVHLPGNDVHIVNFGGEYSVNALVSTQNQAAEKGRAKELRSLNGKCPEILTEEEYRAEVTDILSVLNLPEGFAEGFSYAACIWIFDHIRKANGLGIFCHPYWISDVFQVPESFTDYMMETRPFDAFEVCGGELYYEQNGFQWAKYYNDREKGRLYPVVGSTDSHGSVHNDKKLVAKTMVFSKANERSALISSIKDCYSVAIDTIGEDKFIGEFRLVKYACFLMRNYFPLHDDLCHEEGRAMKDHVCGNESAGKVLEAIAGRTESLRRKYFQF